MTALEITPEILRHVRTTARALCGADTAAIDDLVQDALLLAVQRHTPGVRNTHAWLNKITRNLYVHAYRGSRRRARLEEDRRDDIVQGLYGRQTETTPETHALQDEVIAMLRVAISNMSPLRREIMQRIHHRGQTYRVVAKEMGVPMGTVLSSLWRARAELARVFQPAV